MTNKKEKSLRTENQEEKGHKNQELDPSGVKNWREGLKELTRIQTQEKYDSQTDLS